jgi:arginine N-succinyltransferase
MFLLRSIKEKDLDALFELSKLFNFINLPSDQSVLKKKIDKSIQTFSSPSKKLEENYYIFVVEDLEKRKIIGASLIHGKHGTDNEPHFYLKVGQEHKFSKSLNTGFIHGTLKFDLETDGWSEIGGLVLDPQYRGHAEKIGKQLSFVRFLYMGLTPQYFTEYIHSELMPPFDSKGKSPLWEAIGRKFLNMEYQDADILSRKNKEFILSLYPIDTIYETLLPLEARNSIGKVGDETLPVKKMLESIGFHYAYEVDPFDGGPHFRAKREDIKPIKNLFTGAASEAKSEHNLTPVLLNIQDEQNHFSAIKTLAKIEGEQLIIAPNTMQEFNIGPGTKLSGIYI